MPDVGITTTLGARPLISPWTERIGALATMSAASIVPTELPISRFCDAPTVPVTTTASRLAGLLTSVIVRSVWPTRAATSALR